MRYSVRLPPPFLLPTYTLLGARVDLVPPEVLELKERRGQLGQTDCKSGLSETLA
jgi:hypothetical protein